jgi:dihydrofolate reductase
MWNLVSLDGFFEGAKSWDLGWHDSVWGEELERLSIDQLKSADMLLFGRATYEGMASNWPSAKGEVADLMNQIRKVVFSRTLEKASWNNTRLVKGNAEEEVAKLKKQPGKDLFIFGSANLSTTLIRHRLIDEYRLGLAPIVLGRGTPLFKTSPETMKLKLLEAKPLKSGGVILRYEFER